MTTIASRRLRAQRLTGDRLASAADAVGWLGAVQAQDYAGAKWALALRTRDATDAQLDALFDQGAILRTHVLRPTWHFVLPDDVHWLLELTAPRVKSSIATYDRRLEIDSALRARTYAVIEAALDGGGHLTRHELAAALEREGIQAAGQRLGHLMCYAELDGVVVSGKRRGKQFTYALLDERAPHARHLDRDEALATLARRYFTGHGPAQLRDFAWWSGLTLAEAKHGVELAGDVLAHEVVLTNSYWFSIDSRPARNTARSVHLLPNFDEFLVAYRDRTASLKRSHDLEARLLTPAGVLGNVVVVNGQVRAGWRRRRDGDGIVLELVPLMESQPAVLDGVLRAAAELGRFLDARVSIRGVPSLTAV